LSEFSARLHEDEAKRSVWLLRRSRTSWRLWCGEVESLCGRWPKHPCSRASIQHAFVITITHCAFLFLAIHRCLLSACHQHARCCCCFALVVLLLSRSAPLDFYSTPQYTILLPAHARTHAREHQPVWFALIRTGLDWTGLNRAAKSIPLGFESCSAV
jgi:hypothetical protein